MSFPQWSCRDDSTKIDLRIRSVRQPVSLNPLERFDVQMYTNLGCRNPNSSDVVQVKKSSSMTSDPLGIMLDGDDPLSLFQKQSLEQIEKEEEEEEDSGFQRKSLKNKFELECEDSNIEMPPKFRNLQPWATRKEEILSQFNSHEVLSMTSWFSLQDKILKNKTENPEDLEEGIIFNEVCDMTPDDFHCRIQNFHEEVIRAWNEDQRVRALKIVIQCSKLLSDTYTCEFYPSKFIYITDILDTFGNLVYMRLKMKCCEMWKPDTFGGKYLKTFPENFTSEMVPEAAKETCYNWFYKIASIRELIPRLYVEIALLRSYRFIKDTKEYDAILSRLTKMTRGVANPLVNVYARCYLSRIAAMYCSDSKFNFFAENFFEFLAIYKTVYIRPLVSKKKVDIRKYVEVFIPALEWMVQGMLANDESTQYSLFDSFRKTEHNSLLLLVMLTSFRNSYVVSRANDILTWIEESDLDEIPVYKLVKLLAKCYKKQIKQHMSVIPDDVINSVWLLIMNIDNTFQYMNCVEQWLPLSIRHLPVKRVDFILYDVVSHINKEKDVERCYPQLENIVRNLTENIDDFMSLIIVENFTSFMRLFRDEAVKINICKIIMQAFIKRSHETFINDTVVLNNLMTIAKTLHDSINALTFVDEKRQISNLISAYVRRIDFKRDFEQQLEFYVEARGTFFNLDAVYATLVHCVNKLSFETLKVVKGRHTSKTCAFVRACAAYCFITIPSVSSPVSRLQLLLISGQTALANQCFSQAEVFFTTIIDALPEFPKVLEGRSQGKTSDDIVMSYIRELFSILLVVPDYSPGNTALSLVQNLINKLLKYSWDENNSARVTLYIHALHLLNVAYQSQYPYHFLNVDSNDVLYAADPDFRNQINDMCSVLLQQILRSLKVLGESGQTRIQAKLACELFYCVLIRADVDNLEMAKLSINLWNLANRYETSDKSKALSVLKSCLRSSPPESTYADVFSKLIMKLEY